MSLYFSSLSSDRKRSVRHFRAASLVMALSVLTLSACGSSSSSASSTSKTTSASSSSSAKTLTPATIALAVNVLDLAPVGVAQKEGFFKKEGINAKVEVVQGSSVADSALAAGTVQFSGVSSTAAVLANAKGLPLESVVTTNIGNTIQMFVSSKWLSSHPVPSSASADTKLASLKGATIGELSSSDKAVWKLAAKYGGFSYSNFHKISFTSISAEAAAIKQGLIDAFAASPPSTAQLTAEGLGSVLVGVSNLPLGASQVYDIVLASRAYAKSHPSVVKGVATAVAMADNFLRDHPNKAVPVLVSLFPGFTASELTTSLKETQFPKNGLATQSDWNDAIKWNVETGAIPSGSTAKQGVVWTNQYINTAALG